MLFCNGACGDDWLDTQEGCQKADADAFCKLKLCSGSSYASSYAVSKSTHDPGFGCPNAAASQEGDEDYGDWFGMVGVKFEDDIKAVYGYGDVISDVMCLTSGNYSYYF